MSADPSFPMYANDYLAGSVATLNLDEIGAYSLLLAFDWTLNGLPVEREKLARLIRVSNRKFAKIWPAIEDKFPVLNGRRYNQRLALERAKKGIRSVQASEAAAKRWHSDGNADASISHRFRISENDATTTSSSPVPGTTNAGTAGARDYISEPTASPDGVPSPINAAVALVAAANRGLAEHPTNPQPIPRILATQGATKQAVDKIIQAGVPIAFAESTIYELAKSHSADRVNSLNYFVAAVGRRWAEECARNLAESMPAPPPIGDSRFGTDQFARDLARAVDAENKRDDETDQR